jgi:hypothetical protein
VFRCNLRAAALRVGRGVVILRIMTGTLLKYCVSSLPSFTSKMENAVLFSPPDEDESVVVFTQPPRDELFRLLSGDPMVPLTSLENDSIRQLIQEHPDTCREKYPFEWYSDVDYNFLLSWLCLRQATRDVIELAYNAHPPAIHEEGTYTVYPCTMHATRRHRWRWCSF